MTPLEQLKKSLQDTRESLMSTASTVSRFSSMEERYYTARADDCAAQLAAVEALEVENAKLRAALEPFAALATPFVLSYSDTQTLLKGIEVGDLRRAAQVLAKTNARKEVGV